MTPAIILALAAATSSAAVTATSRYAVVIGHNHTPDPERASLRYADDDAARFYELLAPTLQDGALLAAFDDESQRTFASLIAKARPPTRAMVEATIEAFKSAIAADRSRGQRTELYFFYAGHGDVDDGVGYVNLADDRMTRDDFKRLILAEPRADATHVFVDACKSYFFVAGRGPGGERRPQPRSRGRTARRGSATSCRPPTTPSRMSGPPSGAASSPTRSCPRWPAAATSTVTVAWTTRSSRRSSRSLTSPSRILATGRASMSARRSKTPRVVCSSPPRFPGRHSSRSAPRRKVG